MNRNPGEVYADLWREYVAARRAFDARSNALAQREASELAIEAFSQQTFSKDTYESRTDLTKRAAAIVARLVGMANEAFTPTGCPALSIPYGDFQTRFVTEACADRAGRGDVFRPEQFDPAALWRELEQDYGGEKGVALAYRKAACCIDGEFDLRPGAVVERRREGIVLSTRVYIDSSFETRTRKPLSWGRQGELAQLLGYLQTFAVWAEDASNLAGGLEETKRRLCDRDYAVVSRQRIRVSPALHIVTYHTRFEFIFGAAIGVQLQLFLALYGRHSQTADAQEAA
ncbi:hypothetical protein [Lamprocystis purpurea]|jgi:hypothetical protein|uniref:hypothetical protein n=1 Tax=Lamprocystis purpurea TaxID=61598 RepID=UPI00036F7047|nr:hypothetical protein [Lamprocystis purpurea]